MGRVLGISVATIGSLSLIVWLGNILINMGVFLPKMSEEDKIERRIDFIEELPSTKIMPGKLWCDDFAPMMAAIDIEAWEHNEIFLFGYAKDDTFRWYGIWPGMTRAGYHEETIAYRNALITGWGIWKKDGEMQEFLLPDSVPDEWSWSR